MEYSLRRSFNDNDKEEEGEESHGGRHHDSSSSILSSPSPSEVILKMDPRLPSFAAQTTANQHHSSSESASQVGRDTSLSGDFSFHTGGVNRDGQDDIVSGSSMDRPSNSGDLSGDITLDMDYDSKEIRHQQDPTRRQELPPLPREQISGQKSRNQSDDYSVDFSTYSKTSVASHASNNNMNNTHGNKNTPSSNVEGNRVSFQNSFNSDAVRKRQSIYSTVDGGSSTNSSTRDDEEDGGSRIGRSGVQSRRDNRSGEMLRCTSTNNASLRRRPSMAASRARSRLADIPSTPTDQKSGQKLGQANMKSSQLNTKSGIVGKSSRWDEEEEDPFQDEDLPEEYKVTKISAVIVIEWVSLVVLIGTLICSLIIPVLKIKTLWRLKLWKWEVLILVLICGRLVSDWGMRIIVFFIERNFLLRKRILYFVYGLKKAVQNVIWLGLVLLTWNFLFDKRVRLDTKNKPLQVVTKLLVICEICALIWLVKTLLVKVCASTFHVTTFFERIQDALFNQYVIETLSGPPSFDMNSQDQDEYQGMEDVYLHSGVSIATTPEGGDVGLGGNKSVRSVATQNGKNPGISKSPIGQSIRYSGPINKKMDKTINIDHLQGLNHRNVSAWNMKRLVKIVRHGSLATLDETIVGSSSTQDDTTTQIRSENEAKAAAKKIFRNVAQPRCRYIYIDDLLRFMREEEALKTMDLFEGSSESDRISKRALKNWVVAVFKERKALAYTLTDTKTAVNKLHKIADVIVCIIILLIVATTLNIISSKSIVFLSSQVVVAAFVFGNTCKNVFESIIFLFVVHPFDVGDRCEIDAVQMIVEEMNILTTIFLRYDNLKIVYPNYVLLTKPINNFNRSPDMGDIVEFSIHIATPIETITQMRQRIMSYIDNKKDHWHPNPIIIIKNIENLQMLRVAIWLLHRINHQEVAEKWGRRALLIEECVRIFKDLDMEYRVYRGNVNIHSITSQNVPQIPFPSLTTSSDGHRDVPHT